MAIYDNISGDSLATALKKTLEKARRADFCIGYFNLRGWDLLLESVDALPGDRLTGDDSLEYKPGNVAAERTRNKDSFQPRMPGLLSEPKVQTKDRFGDAAPEGVSGASSACRVLIGMQRQPARELEDYYALQKNEVSNEKAARMKKEMAAEFRTQLTIGRPNNKDEATLRKLCQQLKTGQVLVKLHLAFPLHAKLYLWWFVLQSDCRHLNLKEIGEFPISLNIINDDIISQLENISKLFQVDLQRNSFRKEANYKATGRVIYDEFYPKLSKPIIDEIDKVLAKHYGFTEEELDFIINYDIKYRMGGELEGEA
jgi:hypothetical protein